MTVSQLASTLATDPGAGLHFMLPDGGFVPAHFHITEVGRVRKDFVDCGGTVRSSTTCLLQLWVAGDTEHRLTAGKLGGILRAAAPLLAGEDLPLEVEYEGETISQYPLGGVEVTPGGLLFHLGTKHTACLAPDACGVPGAANSACAPGAGCC